MSKDTYTPEELEQAVNDFWFADDYVDLGNGHKILKSEFDSAVDLVAGVDGTETVKLFQEPVTREIRRMLIKAFDIPEASVITISWDNGQNKITLEANGTATDSTQKLEKPSNAHHYSQAEFEQAIDDFWK